MADGESRKKDVPRESFEALWREHSAEALAIVRRRLGSQLRRRVDSEDVMQEAFLTAADAYAGGVGTSKPEAEGRGDKETRKSESPTDTQDRSSGPGREEAGGASAPEDGARRARSSRQDEAVPEAPDPDDGPGFRRWLAKIIEHRILRLVRFHLEAKRRSVLREVPLGDETPSSSRAGNVLDTGRARAGRRGVGHDETASRILLAKERADALRAAYEKLSPKQREVIDLVHFRKLKIGEAAGLLGKTRGATSVLLYQALKRLGELMGKDT